MDRRAEMLEEEPLTPHDGLVMQISRWDQLKDPIGVLDAFAKHVELPFACAFDGHASQP